MSTKKQSPKNNQEDVFLRWKTEAREILIQESNEKLVELTQQIGQTVRSNIQRGIVDKELQFLYNQACEILYDRGYFND